MIGSVRVLMAGVVLSCVAAAGSTAQTVDEIVAKNLEARGGVERLRAIETVRIRTVISVQGMELPRTSWMKRPNKVRIESRLPEAKAVVAFDGTTAWGIHPKTGAAQEITGPEAEALRDQADFDPLFLDYEKRGTKVEFAGMETLDGRSVYHLRVERKNGQVQQYYLDGETALEVRIVTVFEKDGMKADIADELSDYRKVEGLRVPFTLRQTMNGIPRTQVAIQEYAFNLAIEDEFFRLPRTK